MHIEDMISAMDRAMLKGLDAIYRPSAADLSLTMDDTERAAWLAQRCGKLTASSMRVAMSFKKNGEPAKERSDLQRAILAERLTGLNMRHYVNPAMQWGIEQEPHAKAAYSAVTGRGLRPSGFYDHPSIDMCGATPDAELNGDGLAEFKCPTSTTYLDWVLAGIVPEDHKPQMLLQLACTGRKWVEFVGYEPRLREESKRLFIRRFEPTAEEIAAIEYKAKQFLDEVDALWERFVNT